MATGKVLRFDETHGYGFIAPDDGGDDVFVHANDLLDSKTLFRSGQRVMFELETGERGPKASDVRIVGTAGDLSSGVRNGRQYAGPTARASAASDDSEDGLCDLLSDAEMQHELTEALLTIVPPLTGEQILQARRRLIALARGHNWIES